MQPRSSRENAALLQDVCFTPLHVFSSLLLGIGSGCGVFLSFFLFFFIFLFEVPASLAQYPTPFPSTLPPLIIKGYFKGLEYSNTYFIPQQNVNVGI